MIEIVTPGGTVGTVHITVTTEDGSTSPESEDEYTYDPETAPTITTISTSTGGSGGGTSVTITGTGFEDVTDVDLGGTPVEDFTVISPTKIVAILPPMAVGVLDLTVTANGLVSALVAASRFTITAASTATVSSLGTSSGSTAGGTTVTITGTGFTGAGAVYFGEVRAAGFTVNPAGTSITAVRRRRRPGPSMSSCTRRRGPRRCRRRTSLPIPTRRHRR